MVAIVCSKDVGKAAAQSYLKRAPEPTPIAHPGRLTWDNLNEQEKRSFIGTLGKVGGDIACVLFHRHTSEM